MSINNEAKYGEIEGFLELIEKCKVQMYKTAKAILKNEDDVCDAIQEALFSAYKNMKNLKNERYFKTWIIRITVNKCYDLIRKNSINNKKQRNLFVMKKKWYKAILKAKWI